MARATHRHTRKRHRNLVKKMFAAAGKALASTVGTPDEAVLIAEGEAAAAEAAAEDNPDGDIERILREAAAEGAME